MYHAAPSLSAASQPQPADSGRDGSSSDNSSNRRIGASTVGHPMHQHDTNLDKVDDTIRQTGPEEVMKLLSQELLQVHISKRSAIEEEIHGVHCMAVPETPQLIQGALYQLHVRLEDPMIIPAYQKQAYLRCQHLELQQQKTSYINTDDFRLMFLRCDLFDIAKTAIHIVEWLEYVVTLFGEYALERPITVHDFTKAELRILRQGYIQLLPFRDFSGNIGRKVCVLFPNEHWTTIPLGLRNKLVLYMLYVVAAHDVDTQRKGLVAVAWFDANDYAHTTTTTTTNTATTPGMNDSLNSTTSTGTSTSTRTSTGTSTSTSTSTSPSRSSVSKIMLNPNTHSMGCVRLAGIHICTPDTAFYKLRTAIISMRIQPHYRIRCRMHVGGPVELRYILASFGIVGAVLPMTWSGGIKTAAVGHWLRLRQHLEQQQRNRTTNTPRIVECPVVHDVLFRKGTSSVTTHMGNIQFRNLMDAKLHHAQSLYDQQQQQQQIQVANEREQEDCIQRVTIEQEDCIKIVTIEQQQQQQNDHNKKSSSSTTTTFFPNFRKISKEIIAEVLDTNGGRFLVWNKDYGGWDILTDRETMYTKVHFSVRFYYSHEFLKQQQQQHRCSASASASPRPSPRSTTTTSRTTTGTMTPTTTNMQTLQSGTSIFQFETNTMTNKRQKYCLPGL